MTLAIVTAADGRQWEARLLSRLAATPDAEVAVVRRCVDVAELAAVALSGQAVAVLVDAQLRRLDAGLVGQLTAAGVVVVGVITSEAESERLRQAGIRYAVPDDADPTVIGQVVRQARDALLTGDDRIDHDFSDPAGYSRHPSADGSSLPPGGLPSPGQPETSSPGKVIAVWGPTGAPGRTTVAANLAAEIASLGPSCLVIDADVYGGVVANLLGLLDESPGLVAACRQAQSNRLDLPSLASLCWQLSPNLRVLTGIARAERWPEVRPAGLETVLALSARLADYTVVDLGFGLETDEELSYDTMAPRRNGATLAALHEADLILVVGAADPIGMQRLIRGLAELHEIRAAAPVWVLLNKVRGGSVPGNPERELDAALRRFAGRPASAMLPYDRAGLDASLIAGKVLAEAAPGSPLRRAFVELAASVTGEQTPAPVRRNGRGRRRAATVSAR